MKQKCLIIDDMHESIIPMLEDLGVEPDYQPQITREEIIQCIGDYEMLIVRSKTEINEGLLENARRLKIIARAGAGLDKIDLNAVKAKEIKVINAPEGNRDALGEHAMGMLLSIMNNLHRSHDEVKRKEWQREKNRGCELSGRTVGLIGYGNMARAFAQRLSCFGCHVLAYDKYKTNYGDQYAGEATMDQIYQEAEILSVHVPLTDETRDMIDMHYFSRFKNNIWFLNTARGEIAGFEAINEALSSGKVIAAGLDVLENEKLHLLTAAQQEQFDKLVKSSNVLISPHVAGWSVESYRRINEVLVDKLSRQLKLTL